MQLIFVLIVLAIFGLITGLIVRKQKRPLPQPVASIEEQVLAQHVAFYQQLNKTSQASFLLQVQQFLARVRITGVRTVVEDLDRVLVAAGAVIPVFNIEGWEYEDLEEVLIYPGAFGNQFNLAGGDRNILGIVGEGALQNEMILSQQDLRAGFLNPGSMSNPVIHECAHLIDKTDGATDGLPEALLPKDNREEWQAVVENEIRLIELGQSRINPYAATNRIEFFAVASEYFFMQPQLLKNHHPELYRLLCLVYHYPVERE